MTRRNLNDRSGDPRGPESTESTDSGQSDVPPILRFWKLSRADLTTPPPPQPPDRGLLPSGEAMTLIGRPGIGKTWAAMQLAISVATGRPWLGHYETGDFDLESTAANRRVLFISDDEDMRYLVFRLRAAARAIEATPQERASLSRRLMIVSLLGRIAPFFELRGGFVHPTAHLQNLQDVLDEHGQDEGWGLIVLDPDWRLAGMDIEGRATLARHWYVELRRIASNAPGSPTVLSVGNGAIAEEFPRLAELVELNGRLRMLTSTWEETEPVPGPWLRRDKSGVLRPVKDSP